jgi:phosphonate transport system permease protein
MRVSSITWSTPESRLGTRGRWRAAAWGTGLVAVAWAVHGSQVEPAILIQGLPFMADFARRLFPPNVALAPSLVGPTLETAQMAIVGTLLAIMLAVPLGLLAARNLSPHPLLYAASRAVLNALRGINEFVFALVFVSAVGLGPFPGVLALAVHTAGMLGKFYAEAIEGVDPGPVEGIEATGANRLQTIRYAILPQVMPAVVAFNLYRFEVAVRSATVLGLVGAGGIGFQLMASMRLFKYRDVAMILVIILALVMLTDLASSRIRRRFL